MVKWMKKKQISIPEISINGKTLSADKKIILFTDNLFKLIKKEGNAIRGPVILIIFIGLYLIIIIFCYPANPSAT